MARKTLKEKYLNDVRKEMAKEFDIKNPMAVPNIEKITVNIGVGDELRSKEKKTKIIEDFSLITGQRPKIQKARISVAGFGIRAGMPVGLTSTLRGDRMYTFLDKLIAVVLPRIRDFRGVPRSSFDSHGNYTLGVREYSIFPEIDLAKVDKARGLEITITTTSKSKKQSRRMLELLGFPFEKEEEEK